MGQASHRKWTKRADTYAVLLATPRLSVEGTMMRDRLKRLFAQRHRFQRALRRVA